MDLKECIVTRAREQINNIPGLEELLEIHKSDDSLLPTRINELAQVHRTMLDKMGNPVELDKYPLMKKLKALLGDESDLTYDSPANVESMDSRGRLTAARKTFAYIASHKDDEWAFISTIADPQKLMSMMLPKGYARFLEYHKHIPGLADLYESAIMEVLQSDFPDSTLAQDLLPHYPVTQSA